MQVIPYEPQYRQDFITAWILDNFGFLEPEDHEMFDHIEEALAQGAMIYFAVEDGVALATCMTKPMTEGTWEICKLGSNKNRPHKGCGSAVFEAAMQWAILHGAKRLFLLSNSRLTTALHLYKQYGFQEAPLDCCEYVRGDIAFEKILTDAT